jgi:hypothetical protein
MITTIDPELMTSLMIVNMSPKGTLTNDGLRLTTNMTVFTGSKSAFIAMGEIPTSVMQTLAITKVFGSYYPLDAYQATVVLYSELTATKTIIPLALEAQGSVLGWSVTYTIVSEKNGIITLKMDMSRSTTTVFFSIAVNAMMWLLSLSILILAVTLWIRKRKVEPGTIGIAAALLFSLPQIRNLQPGIGVVGTTIDAVGFFWNMFFIAIALFLLIWNYILKYQKEGKSVDLEEITLSGATDGKIPKVSMKK